MDFRDPSSIPLPTTDDDFERLCLLVARSRYGPEFYRYGRRGQAQHGIDIYSAYHDGRVLQCKLYKKHPADGVLVRALTEDFQAAREKFPDLKEFIFAISTETRPGIQDACAAVTNGVRVIPWFWDQLQQDIAHSKWLLRYYLNYAPGAHWINLDFISGIASEAASHEWLPFDFYGGHSLAQWWGVVKDWDAPRRDHERVCEAIRGAFQDVKADLPIAAIVRAPGGFGKSVFLRRIAFTLMNTYTVYWISDNGDEFFENEWIYDIEAHPQEKYLIIFDDWYRNVANLSDKKAALSILQRVRTRPNVRLVIGDRPSSAPYYPDVDGRVFDLRSDENELLLRHIATIVPEWRHNLTNWSTGLPSKTGLFQLLFLLKNSEGDPIPGGLRNYLLEIVQSDYDHLRSDFGKFYGGLATAIYFYAHIYVLYSARLSFEALLHFAEHFSSVDRPHDVAHDCISVLRHPIVSRYLEVSSDSEGEVRFLHDTLADEAWMQLRVDAGSRFRKDVAIPQLLQVLSAQDTASDLAHLIHGSLSTDAQLVSEAQFLTVCDRLATLRCESAYFTRALTQNPFSLPNHVILSFVLRLVGMANTRDGFWSPIVLWMRQNMTEEERSACIASLVASGNVCTPVLKEYIELADDVVLQAFANSYVTVGQLQDPSTHNVMSALFKRLELCESLCDTLSAYLFTDDPERNYSNFTTCLRVMEHDDVARAAAAKYLRRGGAHPSIQPACLRILASDGAHHDVGLVVAAELLERVDTQAGVQAACMRVLGAAAADFAASILEAPIACSPPQLIFRALMIAAEVPGLDPLADGMVRRILGPIPRSFDGKDGRTHHLYLQCMKVPLFRIWAWRQEVDYWLARYQRMNRNLFYSLSLSHMDEPDALGSAALFFVRNWRREFTGRRKHWAYMIRALAHPAVSDQSGVRQEVIAICKEMAAARGCPPQIAYWSRVISERGEFPQWRSQ